MSAVGSGGGGRRDFASQNQSTAKIAAVSNSQAGRRSSIAKRIPTPAVTSRTTAMSQSGPAPISTGSAACSAAPVRRNVRSPRPGIHREPIAYAHASTARSMT